jgi:hypothetical protein
LLAVSSSDHCNISPPDHANFLRTARASELQFGPLRAEYFDMIQIALTGICAIAAVFMLTFLKSLLQDSRRHAPRRTRTGRKVIVLPSHRDERESVTRRSA